MDHNLRKGHHDQLVFICTIILVTGTIGYFWELIEGFLVEGKGWVFKEGLWNYGLPIIEMYPIGVLMMYYGFRHYKNKPVKMFFASAIVMTVFELITSYLASEMLGHMLWDYTNFPLNFEGRISLIVSIFWGFGCIFIVNTIIPKLQKAACKLNDQTRYLVVALAGYTVVAVLLNYSQILVNYLKLS